MKELSDTFHSADIEKLQKEFEVLTFPNDFDFIYPDQIPSAGVAIVEGSVELIKNTRVIQTIDKGWIIGISQLLEEVPFKCGCRVKANSKVIMIGKSTLLESIKDKNSTLYPVLGQFRNK